jgi:1-phosphatidylinositol-4-phosphate 5-kinase
MARSKKKRASETGASTDAAASTSAPDSGSADPSTTGAATGGSVVTRTLAPIDVRHVEAHPAEVHLSLEPDVVEGSGDDTDDIFRATEANAVESTASTSIIADVVALDDVALEDEVADQEGSFRDCDEGDESVSSDEDAFASDDSNDERDADADDEDGIARARGFATPPESPVGSPRASDLTGFAAAMRSPAAFLKGFAFPKRVSQKTRGGSKPRVASNASANDPENAGGDTTGDTPRRASFADRPRGEDDSEKVSEDLKHAEAKKLLRDQRRARKARRRLKRLVHAANTMGATVSAKEQTTTQLALCMQLGLTMSLRDQKRANAFSEVSDARLEKEDALKTLDVACVPVEDGSRLPSFRFITHAPFRFERVRAAWGLSLANYAESFALEMKPTRLDEVPNATTNIDGSFPGTEPVGNETATPGGTPSALNSERYHARAFSMGSSEGFGASFADERDDRDDFSLDEYLEENRVERSEGGGDGAFLSETNASRVSEMSRDARLRDRARGDALPPDARLPSQTSLRVISSASASGKSSSWFFCSKDCRFLVKTCTTKERNVLMDILREYSAHAREHRGSSLLPQYYGLYTIEVGSRSAHFIVMNYWFATMHEINKRFDLKGSTRGRRASRRERSKGDAAVLKDLDFLESGYRVENPFAEEVKAAIAMDVAFMRRNRLIDYSMMVGLHFYPDESEARGTARRPGEGVGEDSNASDAVSVRSRFVSGDEGRVRGAGTRHSDGPFAEPAADDTRLQFQLRALETPVGLAYLGIIDILTQYGAAKVAEHACFGTLACGADISCQPPEIYARRFQRFIDAHVLKVPRRASTDASDASDGPEDLEDVAEGKEKERRLQNPEAVRATR